MDRPPEKSVLQLRHTRIHGTYPTLRMLFIIILPIMQAPQRREPRANKQIVFVIFIYMLLMVSNKFTSSEDSNESLQQKIASNNFIPFSSFLSEIDSDDYEGRWWQETANKTKVLEKEKGKFIFQLSRHSDSQGEKFTLNFYIRNGNYIDDGTVWLHLPDLLERNWNTSREQGNKLVAMPINSTQPIHGRFSQNVILQNRKSGKLAFSEVKIEYSLVEKNVTKKFTLKVDDCTITLHFIRKQSNIIGTICLALVLFAISFSEFSAALQLIKKFMDGEENPSHYSFTTMVMALMWDASLCLMSFIEAFQTEENIVLFIIPAFIFALLFTNLQLRAMLSIFQSDHSSNARETACKFNLICYGCIILIYPILMLTNLNSVLFVAFALIFLPQIYTNAVTGQRPDPNSPFYNQFLVYRFLTIIYLRCFPLNIFQLRPNYLLGLGIFVIVGLQFGLLWLQKYLGPKAIFPKFLLPAVYDYSYQIDVLEEVQIVECSICLASTSKKPQAVNSEYHGPELMRTPCGHIYHGQCLSQWMKFKMECPQCRSKLPSYE